MHIVRGLGARIRDGHFGTCAGGGRAPGLPALIRVLNWSCGRGPGSAFDRARGQTGNDLLLEEDIHDQRWDGDDNDVRKE